MTAPEMEKSFYINYGLHDLTLALFRAEDPEEEKMISSVLDDSEKCLQSDFRRLWEMLISGKIDYFRHGEKTIYVFTRSTRAGVKVQRSAIWDKSGEMIPLSHADINSFSEMVEKGFCIDNITIFAA